LHRLFCKLCKTNLHFRRFQWVEFVNKFKVIDHPQELSTPDTTRFATADHHACLARQTTDARSV